jgi:hypothetical protein
MRLSKRAAVTLGTAATAPPIAKRAWRPVGPHKHDLQIGAVIPVARKPWPAGMSDHSGAGHGGASRMGSIRETGHAPALYTSRCVAYSSRHDLRDSGPAGSRLTEPYRKGAAQYRKVAVTLA